MRNIQKKIKGGEGKRIGMRKIQEMDLERKEDKDKNEQNKEERGGRVRK